MLNSNYFQLKKVKGQGHRTSKNTENWRNVYLRAADQAKSGQAPTANQAYAIVRPNLLWVTETFGNWTAAYHVGTDIFACFCFALPSGMLTKLQTNQEIPQ